MATIRPACSGDLLDVLHLACQLSERFEVDQTIFRETYASLLILQESHTAEP